MGAFEPAGILSSSKASSKQALIVLNQKLPDAHLFERIWAQCDVRVCADGGANRLFDYFSDDSQRQKYIPNVVTGDFDSLRTEVKEYYAAAGSKIIFDPDQYATDFMKSVKAINEIGDGFTFIAMPSVGGRVDHNFHAIHMLFQLHSQGKQLFLVSDESITFLLDEGDNQIATPQRMLGKTCGIIPIVGPGEITTTGLEWDVTNWHTSFGTQMSTSNHLVSDDVTVHCSTAMLFTVEIRRNANGDLGL